MPSTLVSPNGRVLEVDMFRLLPADEGEMNCIYGRIGSGKTYTATRMVLDDLRRGLVVYVNWKINFKGYDERKSFLSLFLGLIFFWRKYYYFFPSSNLHYVDLKSYDNVVVDGRSTGEDYVAWVSKLTDCKCYWDEAHIIYDSYEKTATTMEKRNSVLFARHFDRSFTVCSQRPSAIQVSLRANVNRFYKCHKTMDYKFFGKFRFQRFTIVEFQDTTSSDLPDERKIMKLNEDTHMIEETQEYALAIKTFNYWGLRKYFEMYDSKYRRDGVRVSQLNNAELYNLSYRQRFNLLLDSVFKGRRK